MVQQLDFDDRLQKIGRKRRAMANGYTTYMRPDGLVVARPVRQGPRFPLRMIVYIVAALLCFKGFLLAALGPATYNDRVAGLTEGTIIEQAGAWVMQQDPASEWIAGKIGPILR